MEQEPTMFRDQTEADLFSVKVPVRQGMCATAGGNPADAKPIGGNRAAEFGGYFRDRRANSRIAEMHRERKAGTGREVETGAGSSRSGQDAADRVAGAEPMRLAFSAPAAGIIAGVG
jgi:hypothetical protein